MKWYGEWRRGAWFELEVFLLFAPFCLAPFQDWIWFALEQRTSSHSCTRTFRRTKATSYFYLRRRYNGGVKPFILCPPQSPTNRGATLTVLPNPHTQPGYVVPFTTAHFLTLSVYNVLLENLSQGLNTRDDAGATATMSISANAQTIHVKSSKKANTLPPPLAESKPQAIPTN